MFLALLVSVLVGIVIAFLLDVVGGDGMVIKLAGSTSAPWLPSRSCSVESG